MPATKRLGLHDRAARQVAKHGAKVSMWFNLVAAAAWIGLVFPGVTAWRNSILFAIICSLWANIVMHTVGVISSLTARRVDPDDPL